MMADIQSNDKQKLALTEKELASYKREGYIIPTWRFPAKSIKLLRELVDSIIQANPDHQQEQLVCPHLQKGATKPMISDRHLDFLNLSMADGLCSVLRQVVGADVLLWGSQLFCKPPMTGMEIPWHQDGAYWPIKPLANVSAWIAIDEVKKENACLRVIPKSHLNGLRPHRTDNRKKIALDQTVRSEEMNEEKAIDIELEPGQVVLFDVYLIHGSNANTSGKRRAGLVYRYMPSTSLFDRGVPDKTNQSGHLVSYKNRPLFQVIGNRQGENTMVETVRHES
jgi:hypothetical protein